MRFSSGNDMAKPTVLILDDEEDWIARHEYRLRQAGFECLSTQYGDQAIEIAKQKPSIKFALIDEILYVPPVSEKEEDNERQRLQGREVRREIVKHIPNIRVIMVTAAAERRIGGNTFIIPEEASELRRQRRVVGVIHKYDINRDRDGTYDWLVDLMSGGQTSFAAYQAGRPRVIVALGFDVELYKNIVKQGAEICRDLIEQEAYVSPDEKAVFTDQSRVIEPSWVPVSIFMRTAPQALEGLKGRADTKGILIEDPGSKRIRFCPEIKEGSASFKILMFLAERAAKREERAISEGDYEPVRRTTRSKKHPTLPSEMDSALEDFAFERDVDYRLRTRKGVSIEGTPKKNSRLKVAIHRLSQQLADQNIGAAQQLFSCVQGTYRLSFDVNVGLCSSPLLQAKPASRRCR